MDIIPAWDQLARSALEPNPFYESWALIPAVEQFKTTYPDAFILLVWADTAHSQLIGLFPLNYERTYHRCPACYCLNWQHLHAPLGTPLIHKQYVEPAFNALFTWLYQETDATVFSFKNIPLEGEFYRRLALFTQSKGYCVDAADTWERAFLHSKLATQQYLLSHHRKKKRKELVRLRRRLMEQGQVSFASLLPGEMSNIDQWVHDFLQLEQAGWKGLKGTALASKTHERQFSEQLIRGAAQNGQLMMLKMSVNDKPIAMKLNFLAATQGAYALKIAYDEQYAAYSPGVLMELENLRLTLDEGLFDWMDSCAIPNHSMINHLWAERRLMGNIHISTSHLLSKPLIHTMRFIRNAYRHYKGM